MTHPLRLTVVLLVTALWLTSFGNSWRAATADEPASFVNQTNGAAAADSAITFDGVVFERILSSAAIEPVFFDLDAGRYFTPPQSLVSHTDRNKRIEEWKFTDELKRWIRSHGIDLAIQTTGQSIKLIGLEIQGGNLFELEKRSNATSPVEIAKIVAEANAKRPTWISFTQEFAEESYGRLLPFITREGGLGTFEVALTDLRGPNSIQFRYQIVRGPDVSMLTGQPIMATWEPEILGEFMRFLVADVKDGALRLRLPGTTEQIEVANNEVVVRSTTGNEFRARRLYSGHLDIAANKSRVIIYGRGGVATLRPIEGQVQIQLKNRVALTQHLTVWMPQCEVPHPSLTWVEVAATDE